jgi:hypothetical protein
VSSHEEGEEVGTGIRSLSDYIPEGLGKMEYFPGSVDWFKRLGSNWQEMIAPAESGDRPSLPNLFVEAFKSPPTSLGELEYFASQQGISVDDLVSSLGTTREEILAAEDQPTFLGELWRRVSPVVAGIGEQVAASFDPASRQPGIKRFNITSEELQDLQQKQAAITEAENMQKSLGDIEAQAEASRLEADAAAEEEVDTIAIDKLLKQLGASDPNALSTTLPELPTTAEISPATLEKQQAYLQALKEAKGGYGQDKWMALADWGRATMAETPQYQGESIMSIAARTGEKPLAALQAAQKEEKAANLGYLKAELDTEINNEAFKTKADQARFTNILALKAANAQIRNADAAWWVARHPKGSLSRKITDDDVEMSVSFLEQLIPQGAKSEKLLAKVQGLNSTVNSLPKLERYLGRLAADNNVANIIAHETEAFKNNYLRDNGVNAKKEDIDGNNIMVLLNIIEENPELADGWMLTRALGSIQDLF